MGVIKNQTNLIMGNSWQKLYQVRYEWDHGVYLECLVFMKTQAGAIAKTFRLALACGLGEEPDTCEVNKLCWKEVLEGYTVKTNFFQYLKNSKLKAEDKRDIYNEFMGCLNYDLTIDSEEVTKYGKLIR